MAGSPPQSEVARTTAPPVETYRQPHPPFGKMINRSEARHGFGDIRPGAYSLPPHSKTGPGREATGGPPDRAR